MYGLVSIVMHEQWMNHIRPRCYAKSRTAEDGFWPIPGRWQRDRDHTHLLPCSIFKKYEKPEVGGAGKLIYIFTFSSSLLPCTHPSSASTTTVA